MLVETPSDAAATGDGIDVPADEVAEPAAVSRRAHGRRVVPIVVGLAVLGISYVGFTFWQVWHAARTDSPRVSDAIVVLGAAQYDGRPSPVLQARLDTALDLYRRGVAPLIVTTGANQEGDRFTEADTGVAYLVERGVPRAALLSVPVGRNTWEELSATADGYEALHLSLDVQGHEDQVLALDLRPIAAAPQAAATSTGSGSRPARRSSPSSSPPRWSRSSPSMR